MNLINLSDGHIDILLGVVHRDLQRLLAQDLHGGEEMNYDKAAHLLTIYNQISNVASKWTNKYPQFGCRPLDSSGQEREIIKGTNQYLARDGTFKRRHSPD